MSTSHVLAIVAAAIAAIPIANGAINLARALLPPFAKYAAWWMLRRRFGAELYTREEFRLAMHYYIQPDCQKVDPTDSDETESHHPGREGLFPTIEFMLENPRQYKYVLLLADSGMGKSAFLLNYYVHHVRRLIKPFDVVILPLSRDIDKLLTQVPQSSQSNIVLLLDGLDEDLKAIEDASARLNEILRLTASFRSVIITCRSQFFVEDAAIPPSTPVTRAGVVRPKESRAFPLHRLYLSPFNDAQIATYLGRKFRFNLADRSTAWDIVRKIPDLAVRPMLLANIDDILKAKMVVESVPDVYEAMVDAWLEREEGFAKKSHLRAFSEVTAVTLFQDRRSRGWDRIPAAELAPLAASHGIPLKDWQLRSRSLLNRDGQGNYKFAHRSLMEYLFVEHSIAHPPAQLSELWTDMMRHFLREMIDRHRRPLSLQYANIPGMRFTGASLDGIDFSFANLSEARLSRSTLRGAICRGTDFRSATIIDVDLDGADMKGSTLEQSILSRVAFKDTILAGANLARCRISKSSMNNADFSSADISAPTLDGVRIDNCSFALANCQSATVVHSSVRGTDFQDTVFDDAKLARMDFESNRMSGMRASRAVLEYASFAGTNAKQAIFHSADLRGASFEATDCVFADFRGAMLAGVDFARAALTDADLTDTDLAGVRNLTDAQLRSAISHLRGIPEPEEATPGEEHEEEKHEEIDNPRVLIESYLAEFSQPQTSPDIRLQHLQHLGWAAHYYVEYREFIVDSILRNLRSFASGNRDGSPVPYYNFTESRILELAVRIVCRHSVRSSGVGVDLRRIDLSGVELRGIKLPGHDFSGASFSGSAQ